jgi:hypothetical protein
VLAPFSFSGGVSTGDVVVLDTGAANTVQTTTTAKDPNVIGFVQGVNGSVAYVAVFGRVTNAVANGAITIGNSITTSTSAGKVDGNNNLQTGRMIGIALTSAAGNGDPVTVLIQRF